MNDTNVSTSTTNAGQVRKPGRKAKTANPSTVAAVPISVIAAAAKPQSKTATVIKLLTRARGATAAEISEPTGWQPHSVRSYLTGLRKKGTNITREKRKTGETVYRIAEAVLPSPAPVVPDAAAHGAEGADNATAAGA